MVAIVVPARNEQARIGSVLERITASGGGPTRLFVVDDGSADDTGRAAGSVGVAVLRHRVNLGKGAALLTGADAALAAGADFVVLMDADGQHDPADIPRLLEPLTTGRADLVLGYRSFSDEMPPAMRLGNAALSRLFATLFGLSVRDTQCGFRAITSAALKRIRWTATDYAVETEMLVLAARHRLRIEEVPIATVYHDRYKGTTPVDGLKILANMIRWRLA